MEFTGDYSLSSAETGNRTIGDVQIEKENEGMRNLKGKIYDDLRTAYDI